MKKRIEAYTFDASLQTVTFTDYATIELDAILIIVNVLDQVIIYNPFDAAKGGTVATNVLTLEFDTSSPAMADTDPLLIFYDDGLTGEHRDNLITAEYNTTGAQTNDDMLGAIASGTRIGLVGLDVVSDEATTVGVGVRIGFGTLTVPAEASSGATAVAGVPLSHPGIAPGSGPIKMWPGDKPIFGASGEELRITCGAPTTGKLTVVITYFTVTD